MDLKETGNKEDSYEMIISSKYSSVDDGWHIEEQTKLSIFEESKSGDNG